MQCLRNVYRCNECVKTLVHFIFLAQSKFKMKMCESGLQMHQVIHGNPQHVLSSHLPTLKMPTLSASQMELLYG